MTIEERFLAKIEIDPVSGCWLWTASLRPNGYGQFNDGTKITKAHRWAYEHFVGPIPEGHDVGHSCHDADATCDGGATCAHRRCVNYVEHLVAQTRGENLRASPVLQRSETGAPAAKRAKTACPSGHPYDETNTLRSKEGHRRCRQCARDKARARYESRKAA